MKNKQVVVRLSVLLVLTAALMGLLLHFFTEASAAPPVPTPTFSQVEEVELENQFLTGPQISPADIIATGVVTFYAAADTQVLQGASTTNYGVGSPMRSGYSLCLGDPPGIHRSIVQFDLSHVPPGTTINSARLDLYLSSSCDYSGQYRTITTYQVASDWQEESVTWNTQPSLGSSYGAASVLHGAWGWYSFDVTNLVRNWVDGTSNNYGIMLRGPETGGGWRGFCTKGAGRYTYGPRLIVDLVLPPPTLSAATSPMQFTNDAAGPITQTKELIIQNLGEDTLDWSASESVSWLSLDKASGTAVRFTSPDTIRVSVDRSSLSLGYYTGQIQITSSTPGVQGSPQSVDVTFDLVEELLRIYLPIVLKGGSGASTQNVVALVIGISDYEDMGLPTGQASGRAGAPGNDCGHCYKDAVGVSNILDDRCCGLCGCSLDGVASQSASCGDIKMLVDSWATKEAMRQAIIYWLDEQENEDTMVIVFFSGHGMYALDDDGDEADGYDEFIVPYDIQYDDLLEMWLPETAIRDDEFDEWLDELESNQIVIILDSCFSGGIAAGATASGRGLLNRTDLGVGAANLQAGDSFAQDVNESGRVVLMASAADQESWEFSELEHGVFTYYLLQALSSTVADTNHDGWVSAEEAFSYLAGRVDSYVQSHPGTDDSHQYPQISDGVAGEVNLTQP